jgi:hypothetical protein
VINKKLVDKANIVIALFDSRLGQATPRRRHTRAGLVRSAGDMSVTWDAPSGYPAASGSSRECDPIARSWQ